MKKLSHGQNYRKDGKMNNEQLDRWLATEIMEIAVDRDWRPTTDIAQAMECLEGFAKLHGNGYEQWSIGRFMNTTGEEVSYVVCINDHELAHVYIINEIPLAICNALYEAVKGGE
jgi:hypothetical protein